MTTAQKDSFFRKWITLFKNTWTLFSNVNGLKFSASLAYYTLFSIAPLLLLVITIITIFLGDAAIEGQIYEPMEEIIGGESANTIETMIKNLSLNNNNPLSLTISIVTLIIGATGVFGDMQTSINKIWDIKPKPKRGWVKMLKDRLRSSSLVLSLGFILIVSFLINGIINFGMGYIGQYINLDAIYAVMVVEFLLNFLILKVLMMIIFKFLPDVNLKWRTVRSGAIFTALLFIFGRFLISFYINKSANLTIYGTASSLIVVLIWVYYSAAILYLGAAFTRAYAEYKGERIVPADYAVVVEEKELPPAEQDAVPTIDHKKEG